MKDLIRSGPVDVATLFYEIFARLDKIDEEIFKLRNELAVTFSDEMGQKRKDLSNELANRMKAKLHAEHKARLLTNPDDENVNPSADR